MGDRPLVAQRHWNRRVGRHDDDCVGVVFEPRAGGAHIIRHDEIRSLAGELATSIVDDIVRFRGEPDDGLTRRLARAEGGEDVGRWLEDDLWYPAVFLDLA